MNPHTEPDIASHPLRLQRLGLVMEPEPGNPMEVEGVLNPATARCACLTNWHKPGKRTDAADTGRGSCSGCVRCSSSPASVAMIGGGAEPPRCDHGVNTPWPAASTRCMNNHERFSPDTKSCRNPNKHKPQITMTKLITITLAAITLFAVSSCTTRNKAPAGQSKSMPGMSAEEHARM